MRLRLPGTLSARIIIGFAVLVVAFGGISIEALVTAEQLNRKIEIMRIGYLQLARRTPQLSYTQRQLVEYLRDDLSGELSRRRVEARLRGLKKARASLLEELDGVLARVETDAPARDQRDDETFVLPAGRLAEIRAHIADGEPLYEQLMVAPPLDKPNFPLAGETFDSILEAVSADALSRIVRNEVEILNITSVLQRRQDEDLQKIVNQLQRESRLLRLRTIWWGAIALLLGVLMTVWATVTLRPLRRLRDAAGQIARGDYAQRIDERGPREVGDLAREFNTMGQAIQERERELVRAERLAAVGKMAAVVTHEVRNPLSAIGLNAELLEEELGSLTGESGEARGLCRAIQGEVDRLTAITEEYLHFARLPKPKLAPEALGPIVRGVAEFEREALERRSIALELDLAEGLPPVMVDESQLKQALLNLMRNAAEAVADNGRGRIRLSTRRSSGGQVEVCVADDGPGVAEAATGKLFDAFFSTKEGGTGLGLALTHQIIREHGGSIRVESEVGRGATFILSLPAAGLGPA